jgi:glycosyltransferase involved in cell wall biosynthesis
MRELGYTGPVIVAPNGLAVPAFSTPARRADHVLWMGRFDVETKGLDLLLEALATLPPAARPRLRLHGPDWRGGRQQTLALARSLGLEKSVTVGAPLYGDDKWAALRECGLFVFPSRWDAQSVMLLEAAAAGAPLLATNTTPFGRYLEARQAAVVVEATPQALAAGLQRGGSPAAASLGAAAAELARTTFSWPAAAESYVRQVAALL